MQRSKVCSAKEEQLFHDAVFQEEARSVLGKYYSVSSKAFDHYRAETATHCQGKRVLEIGCGPQSQACLLAAKDAVVTGIDISPVAIKMAQRGFLGQRGEVDFVCMDAQRMTFADDSFDIVCGSGILHHLNIDAACREIQRVLKAGGKGVFLEPMGHNPFIDLYRSLTPLLRTEGEHPLTNADIVNIGKRFRSLEARYFNLFTLLAVPFRRQPVFQGMLVALNKVDELAFDLIPPLRGWAWMVVITIGK